MQSRIEIDIKSETIEQRGEEDGDHDWRLHQKPPRRLMFCSQYQHVGLVFPPSTPPPPPPPMVMRSHPKHSTDAAQLSEIEKLGHPTNFTGKGAARGESCYVLR